MKQGDTYVIFVEVYTKSILTLWCVSGIPVMHSDTQNAAQPFNTLCMQPSCNFRSPAHHMGNLIPAPKVTRAK
jgi:hypothetical protein